MEKERSKSVQDIYKQSKNTFETYTPRLPRRGMTAKRSKSHLAQDTPLQATIVGNSSPFLGAVNRHYPGRKQPLLKRLSESSISPCSEEYTFVMQGFKGTERESKSSVHVTTPRRARNRKISCNDFSQGSKQPDAKITSESKGTLTHFQPRPRGNTLPGRINDVKIPAETQPGEKTTPTAQRQVLDVKMAWQGVNDDGSLTVKKEKKRPVSLSDLPQKQLSNEEKLERKMSETLRGESLSGKSEKSGKVPQRKKADVDLPKIEEKGLSDHLQLRETETCYENRGKSLTAVQTDDDKSSIKSENFLASSYSPRIRSYSSGYLTESNGSPRAKGKLSHSVSWEPVFCDRPATALNSNRGNIGTDSAKNFETHLTQSPSRSRRTTQFAITRANIRRVGKATLAATRLLKIHYRENGGKKVISEEEKELDELFEEMKDCRYLRKSTSEMKA